MTDIFKSDIKNIIKGINKKDYSVEELVNHFIKKVDSLDKFNLVSEKTYDEAITLAKKADTKRIEERRPLEGIPIAVKDIFCTVGNKTSASSNILKNFKAPYESTVTKNLKDAGAIVLCKTTMDEFAMGSAIGFVSPIKTSTSMLTGPATIASISSQPGSFGLWVLFAKAISKLTATAEKASAITPTAASVISIPKGSGL